ncbi:hypothetical protein HYQ44_006578 [Verticillium longisporum]|nr:hypothetical protein HYQ44_006578 [Verticillium longisporum]
MANLYFTHSSAPVKTIEEIQFGLMSPEQIKTMSVCHVIYPETMDETRTKPRDSGLNDPLLGSIDRQFKCKTCTQAMGECPGHFGHIELAKGVYHPGFIKKVKKILEIVCLECYKVLGDRNDPEFEQAVNTRDPKQRFHRVWLHCKKKKRCENELKEEKDGPDSFPELRRQNQVPHDGCGNVKHDIRAKALQLIEKVTSTTEDGVKDVKEVPITADRAHGILRRISDDDLRDMGLNLDYARPEWMIITVLPVPPPPLKHGFVVKQQEKEAKAQAAKEPMTNADGSKMSLLDRLRAKEIAAAQLGAPSGPEITRKRALQHVSDVSAIIGMLVNSSNPGKAPVKSFPMSVLQQKLKESLRLLYSCSQKPCFETNARNITNFMSFSSCRGDTTFGGFSIDQKAAIWARVIQFRRTNAEDECQPSSSTTTKSAIQKRSSMQDLVDGKCPDLTAEAERIRNQPVNGATGSLALGPWGWCLPWLVSVMILAP